MLICGQLEGGKFALWYVCTGNIAPMHGMTSTCEQHVFGSRLGEQMAGTLAGCLFFFFLSV